MRRLARIGTAVALLVAAAAVRPARGWEAHTTHAGFTESAALASGLHDALTERHGRELGLYEPLTVTPGSAPALFQKLARLDPSEGYAPDRRGRTSALAWLMAGSVLEDVPSSRGRHHFYDPTRRTGLTGANARGLEAFVEKRIWARFVRAQAPSSGMPAVDWVFSPENDLGMARFLRELEASATAATPADRERHLAFALLCAGAMAHVLQDLGSPSHVRDDYAEHLQPLGAGPSDRGSRFERLASFAYGRLGVPTPRRIVTRRTARDFFAADDKQGLADVTAARWYSSGTLPETLVVPRRPEPGELPRRVARTQRFPSPAPRRELDLVAAARPGGAALRNDDGVCLANYRFDDQRLSWSISDACAAEQLAAIVPEVAAYTAGFLAHLFRGALVVSARGEVEAGLALGEGTLRAYAEDAAGTRRPLGDGYAIRGAAAGKPLVDVDVPEDAVRIIAVFRGVDASGDEVVAIGRSPALR